MPRFANPLLAMLLVAGCRAPDPLLQRVRDASVTSGRLRIHTMYALPPFTDAPMAVYFTVGNGGSQADTLLAAASPASAEVMFHGAGMRMIGAQPIAPGGELVLAPGGTHLMLSPPLPSLARGDSVEVTLRFAHAEAVTFWVPVIDYDEAEDVSSAID